MGKQYEIYVQKGTPLWKVVTNVLFSHVGLLVLVIGYCILGAQVFIYLEKEREDEEEVAKQDSTRVSRALLQCGSHHSCRSLN